MALVRRLKESRVNRGLVVEVAGDDIKHDVEIEAQFGGTVGQDGPALWS